jgi:hypothetical protein
MIRLCFNVTKDDVLALACHYYAISPTVRRARVTAQVTIAIVLAIIGLLVLSGNDRLRPFGIIVLICALLFAVLFPRWYSSNLRTTAKKMIAESSYQKAFGDYTLELSEEGLASTSPTGQSKHTWEAVGRSALTPEYLFIFLVGPQGYPIQRAQVADSTIQEVRAYVDSHRRSTEPSAAPNGGPGTQLGNSGVTEGPPSVS